MRITPRAFSNASGSPTFVTNPSYRHGLRIAVLVGLAIVRPAAFVSAIDTPLTDDRDVRVSLPDPAARKAATKCQEAIAKAGTKFFALTLKKVGGCSTGVLRCVQTKPGNDACLATASGPCARALTDTLPAAATKLRGEIVKKCGANLSLSDLLAADGLGFGRLVGKCQVEFATDIYQSAEPRDLRGERVPTYRRAPARGAAAAGR
jgi:hypothetical protein